MPYWQLFYHLVWATKHGEPFLTPTIEKQIYSYLTSKAVGLRGVVYALGGTADHVHMAVSIPPAISVAKFVGQVKAVASTRFNKSGLSTLPFAWQNEYGALSFDAKRLSSVVAYVRRQKEHHAEGTVLPPLERMAAEDIGPRLTQEDKLPYLTETEEWREELTQMDRTSPAGA